MAQATFEFSTGQDLHHRLTLCCSPADGSASIARHERARVPDVADVIKKMKEMKPGDAFDRAGPGCLNRFSASISGASAGVRLPSGEAAA